MKQYGFIAPKIETREEGAEHLLGGLGKPIINPSGNWASFWPEPEAQKQRNIETFGCTVWATLNAIETLIKFKTGVSVNYSDRYLANVAVFRGILNPSVGADPHRIAELIRNIAGCLKEDRLPWSSEIRTAEDYYDVQNLAELMKEGPAWYDEWEFWHEWVFSFGADKAVKAAKMKDALMRGTVCASVEAWSYDDINGWYFKGGSDNHWTTILSHSGDKPIAGDSYPESDGDFIKTLSPNYDFGYAKVYYLEPAQPKLSILQKILNFLAQIVGLQAQMVKQKIEVVKPENKLEIEPPKYLWGTPAEAKHSVRVICDEERLSWDEKNLVCAVLECESAGFNNDVIFNKPTINQNGTKDYGIAQLNDYWYIGEGKPCPDVAHAFNPEFSTRLIIKQFKAGRINDWICYRSGNYERHI